MTLGNALTAVMMILVFWLWVGWSDAEKRADDARAVEQAERAMKEVEKQRDEIRKEILNGGEIVLDDYMSGIGERLWGGR